MEKRINKEILERFSRGQCTQEERLIVVEWIKAAENEEEIARLLENHWNNLDEPNATTDFEALFNRINSRLEHSTKVRTLEFNTRLFLKIASVFVGLLMLAGIGYQISDRTVPSNSAVLADRTFRIATSFGEIKRITLPDSSQVILNGNSELSYRSGWAEIEPREVWLQGEAFFSVVHTRSHEKFVVNTSEVFSIEVLGTRFNVSTRKSGTKVILNEGSIELHILKADESKGGTENVIMRPGDLVSFYQDPSEYVRKSVNPEMYSAWTESRLLLDNTPLSSIITFLEETYGLRVVVSDPSMLELRGSGTMPTRDLDLLLKVISETFSLKLQQDNVNVYFSENP